MQESEGVLLIGGELRLANNGGNIRYTKTETKELFI